MEDQVIFAKNGMYIHTSVEKYHQVGITLHENWLAKFQNTYINNKN